MLYLASLALLSLVPAQELPQNLGFSISSIFGTYDIQGDLVLSMVDEFREGGEDLNGDGDDDDTVLFVYDVSTGELVNVGRALLLDLVNFNGSFVSDGRYAAMRVSESAQGEDINGDGDQADVVLEIYDHQARTILPTGAIVSAGAFPEYLDMGFFGEQVHFATSEIEMEVDLNEDGDMLDDVLRIFDLGDGALIEPRLAGFLTGANGFFVDAPQDTAAWVIDEARQGGTDLNGDGDALDQVLFVHESTTGSTTNLGLDADNGAGRGLGFYFFAVDEEAQGGRDLNGDGDKRDRVLHFYETEERRTTNLALASTALAGAPSPSGRYLVFNVTESAQGKDLNGDGDSTDVVSHLYDRTTRELRNLRVVGTVPRFTMRPGANKTRGRSGSMSSSETHLLLDVHESALFSFDDQRFDPTFGDLVVPGQDGDLNGDGDLEDRVLVSYDLVREERTLLGLATTDSDCFFNGWPVGRTTVSLRRDEEGDSIERSGHT